MNVEFEDLIKKAEGRYFNDHEAGRLRGYAEGLISRLNTVQALEAKEEAILDRVEKTLHRKEKGLEDRYGPDVWRRYRRDLQQVIRYSALAMLQRDPDFLVDKLSSWLYTVLAGLVNIDEVVRAYTVLRNVCEEQLEESDAAAFLPFLDMHIAEFSRMQKKAA
ncbi:MAG: hypothetical protein AAGA56_27740 [Myxococcota bacterium]